MIKLIVSFTVFIVSFTILVKMPEKEGLLYTVILVVCTFGGLFPTVSSFIEIVKKKKQENQR